MSICLRSISRFLVCALMLSVAVACANNFSSAESSANQQDIDQIHAQDIIDHAHSSAESILGNKDFVGIKDLMAKSKGVLIFPKLVRGGFLLGGEGGVGVVLARQADGSFGYPAFYNMVGGSFGLQVGVESSETLFLIMTQKGLDSIIKNQFKLGADVSVALGPIGSGLGASKTATGLASDIYAYSKASGLYGGGSFKGAIISVREDLNKAYYAADAMPRDILIDGKFNNYGADSLRAALALENPANGSKAAPLVPVEQF